MNELKRNSFKLLFVSCIGFLLSWGLYYYYMGRDFKNHVKTLQQAIDRLDKQTDLFFQHHEHHLASDQLWENKSILHHPLFCFVVEEDQLIYWNNDQLPIQDSSQFFSSNKTQLVQLSNGFYYVKSISNTKRTIYTGKKVMSNYFYENDNLKAALAPGFELPQEVEINFSDGYAIKDREGHVLFYVSPKNLGNISLFKEFMIFLAFIVAFIAFFLAVQEIFKKLPVLDIVRFFSFPVFVILIWVLSNYLRVFYFFNDFQVFAPDLYAASAFFSDLGMTIIEFVFLGFILNWVIYYIDQWQLSLSVDNSWTPTFSHQLVSLILFVLIFPFAYFINWFAENLVVNSAISFELDNLFALSTFSYIGLFLMAVLFIFYTITFKKIAKTLLSTYALHTIAVLCFIFGIAYFFFDLFYGENPIISGVWPLFINSIILYAVYKQQIKTTTWALLAIALFSLYTTLNFYEFSVINEHQKRQFFAEQIISDRDITLELEFADLIEKIRADQQLKELLAVPDGISQTATIDRLEDCCLPPFWDRYDIRLYIFDEASKDLLDYVENQSLSVTELNAIISEHGEESEIRRDLYFITDYHQRLSYLGRINISFNDKNRIIYFAFRSKKLPEEIGIPRLLINRSSHILDDLQNYSIARYSDNELLMKFGEFNFPTTKDAFFKNIGQQKQFSSYEGSSIYTREGENNQLLVITKPEKTFFEQLTGFSYTFIFYCLVVVLLLMVDGKFNLWEFIQLNLATKIQIVLIGLVVLSFVLFGTVTGSYVQQQYGYFSNDNLKERLQSVHTEISQKLGDKEDLDPDFIGTYMEYILKKFSNVFATDINLYDNTGRLLASSQPNLYSRGISSTQINPLAFVKMIHQNKSDFIHTEKIGNLSYLSAYKPFLNHQNKQLGIINIKHFSKQRKYENQITGFLVAIINIAVLLLILTVIVALFVSKWITTPLRLIQQSFKSVDLGKQNKPIAYKHNDEIGALVKDYNDKLIELELKAMQLARNERETAWREMAKQVAHEIKNPLTPMKLRLQHFQRAFDPNDPEAKEKIAKITASLVEQIDGLTKIANEFSNFAKMPKANEEIIDLIPILKNGVDLFGKENGYISFEAELKEAFVWADKDLFIRVVNNILKNAFQAIPEKRTPMIKVGIKKEGDHYLLSFEDNGKGISSADQHKIFVPNFTTKTTGAGLGLAMVKQIIQNHNGEIWFESEVGKGTTFFVLIKRYEVNRG